MNYCSLHINLYIYFLLLILVYFFFCFVNACLFLIFWYADSFLTYWFDIRQVTRSCHKNSCACVEIIWSRLDSGVEERVMPLSEMGPIHIRLPLLVTVTPAVHLQSVRCRILSSFFFLAGVAFGFPPVFRSFLSHGLIGHFHLEISAPVILFVLLLNKWFRPCLFSCLNFEALVRMFSVFTMQYMDLQCTFF